MVAELTANHSAYYIDDSIAPAPALLANGWNDDLFPVDESIRYYNKVRAKHPNAPISMFHLDFGHSPRAGAVSAADRAALTAAENAWLDYYVKGVGSEPADARGGVDILTSKCPVSGAGTRYHAPTWAQLAPGEIRIDGAAAQTIAAPGTRAVERVHVRRRLHDHVERRQRLGRDVPRPGGHVRLHARGLADDHRQAHRHRRQRHGRGAPVRRRRRDPAADRARRAAPDRRRRRPDASRSSSCTRRPGPSSPATCSSSSCSRRTRPYLRTPTGQQSVQVSDLQLRLPVVDAPGKDLGGVVRVARRRRSSCRRATSSRASTRPRRPAARAAPCRPRCR